VETLFALLVIYALPLAVILFILYFVIKAAVKSAIDEKLPDIKKAFRNEADTTEIKGIKLVRKDTFYICGYSVETTLEENNKDVSALYEDIFSNHKEKALKKMKGSGNGYYGLSWYTQGHERYCYLLGIEVEPNNLIPKNAMLKRIPAATFATARFSYEEDIIKTWTEFFYDKIPEAGLKVDDEYNLYYEFYPDDVKGDYELWVPVVMPMNADEPK